ncbi:MerR family transcriptional regulator [bacterium]|nr:MerR family transcriptional regulator [bacterium]
MSGRERRELGLLTAAEVARAAGVLKSTVRYYTEMGLLKIAGTFSPKSYRLYEKDETVERIRRIREIQGRNRTLSNIMEASMGA